MKDPFDNSEHWLKMMEKAANEKWEKIRLEIMLGLWKKGGEVDGQTNDKELE